MKLSIANCSGGHLMQTNVLNKRGKTMTAAERANVRRALNVRIRGFLAIQQVANPDGSHNPIHKWLCTSTEHYHNILCDSVLRLDDVNAHTSFDWYRTPLNEVQAQIQKNWG